MPPKKNQPIPTNGGTGTFEVDVPDEPQKVRPLWEYKTFALSSGPVCPILDDAGVYGWEVFQVDIFNSVAFAKRLVTA